MASETVEWREGMDVFVENRGGFHPSELRPAKVGKVHKSGRFTLKGGRQQFRPRKADTFHGPRGEGTGYSSDWVWPATDEWRAEAERRERVSAAQGRWHDLVDIADRLRRPDFSDPVVMEGLDLFAKALGMLKGGQP